MSTRRKRQRRNFVVFLCSLTITGIIFTNISSGTENEGQHYVAWYVSESINNGSDIEAAKTTLTYEPEQETQTMIWTPNNGPKRSIPITTNWTAELLYQSTFSPSLGYRNKQKKFLAIGMSTIYRERNYLNITLNSFISESTPEEKADAVIVVFLADTDRERKNEQRKLIQEGFQAHIDSGFIQVIESTPNIYPPMDFAFSKRTFNDPVERVLWRAKQVIDFVYVISYARNISEYYLVAEDDIVCSTEYISAIRDFIDSKQHLRWVALHFTKFEAIGVLFRNSELPRLMDFLMMFYQEQPVDWLMREYINIQVPDRTESLKLTPSVFQHVGMYSTLRNKEQKEYDNNYRKLGYVLQKFHERRRPKLPAAILTTTMKIYDGHYPSLPYKSDRGYFWGIPEKAGDTFDIVFIKPINLTRITILTGMSDNSKYGSAIMNSFGLIKLIDFLTDGTSLKISDRCENIIETDTNSDELKCRGFHRVGLFKDGSLDIQLNFVNVKAFRIGVDQSQKTWVIIRKIEII